MKLRVIFKHIKFSNSREVNDNIEPELLENVGKLILEILKIDETQIETKIRSIENRSFLYTLLKAKSGHKKFEGKFDGIQKKLYLTI